MIDGEKTYEFRKKRLPSTVERIWFYSVAPRSKIEHVCEIEPAITWGEVLAGHVSEEIKDSYVDINPSEVAYKILSVYQLQEPVTLVAMKKDHGIGGAPQRMAYAPGSLIELVPWQKQTRLKWSLWPWTHSSRRFSDTKVCGQDIRERGQRMQHARWEFDTVAVVKSFSYLGEAESKGEDAFGVRKRNWKFQHEFFEGNHEAGPSILLIARLVRDRCCD